MLRLPALQGIVRRRILVNYRVDPGIIARRLPAPFRPKLVNGWAVAGICLIRLEELRPKGFPAWVGLSSENAAHRIAVTWTDDDGEEREGVFIPRRDTGALLNHLTGGRLFPGDYRHARFRVRDDGGAIEVAMTTEDGLADVRVAARWGDHLPPASVLTSLAEASSFFGAGSVGYSPSRGGARLDGLRLRTRAWRIEPLVLSQLSSTYYQDTRHFPPGSIEYDCALIMRDIPHEWASCPPPGSLPRDVPASLPAAGGTGAVLAQPLR
jgi:hypothetical protein